MLDLVHHHYPSQLSVPGIFQRILPHRLATGPLPPSQYYFPILGSDDGATKVDNSAPSMAPAMNAHNVRKTTGGLRPSVKSVPAIQSSKITKPAQRSKQQKTKRTIVNALQQVQLEDRGLTPANFEDLVAASAYGTPIPSVRSFRYATPNTPYEKASRTRALNKGDWSMFHYKPEHPDTRQYHALRAQHVPGSRYWECCQCPLVPARSSPQSWDMRPHCLCGHDRCQDCILESTEPYAWLRPEDVRRDPDEIVADWPVGYRPITGPSKDDLQEKDDDHGDAMSITSPFKYDPQEEDDDRGDAMSIVSTGSRFRRSRRLSQGSLWQGQGPDDE